MKGQDTYSGKVEQVVGVAIAGFALATLICKFNATGQEWSCLDEATRVVLEVLRPVILAGGQCASAYLAENSRCLHHLPQFVASIWPLLCVLAG
jgi:hypothetical protein